MTPIQEARSTHPFRSDETRAPRALPTASHGLSHFHGAAASEPSGMGGELGHPYQSGVVGSSPTPATSLIPSGKNDREAGPAPSGAGAGDFDDTFGELIVFGLIVAALLFIALVIA